MLLEYRQRHLLEEAFEELRQTSSVLSLDDQMRVLCTFSA